MQTDRRFIENVNHADQSAADLPGQANPLRFAAGKRGGRAVERQVIQAAFEQKAQPPADFLESFLGDFGGGVIEIQRFKKLGGFANAERANRGQRARDLLAAGTKGFARRGQAYVAGLGIKPSPLAGGSVLSAGRRLWVIGTVGWRFKSALPLRRK
jgi:hypothetical protein